MVGDNMSSSRVFAPRASIQRVKRPAERIYALSSTPPRTIRSPSPALIRPPSHIAKTGPTPCKICGSTDTEEGDGNIVCRGCGLVLSTAPNYTSDITFEEGSNGRIQQQGQRVADGQTHQKAFAPRGLGGGPGHEATPANEKARTEATGVIRRYAILLRIDEREINMGRRIFEMAYNRGFVRGRTIESVAIVSLYIATRRAKDRKPAYDIMLIDLAEQANINVFDLGRMMQDLIKKLYLNSDGTMSKDDHFYLQAHGAEVLIDKFVNHLDFGPDSTKIKTDATRILQRMKRDWIHHGRRPSGVCGAAVILAARMNNYRRTLREVVLVAKVTEFTVSKRLEEFKETESSNLSVNDFRDDGILASISDMDPPAYHRASKPPKVKGKRGRPRKTAPETAAEIEGGDPDNQVANHNEDGPPATKRPRIDADGFAVPDVPLRTSTAQPTPQANIDPVLHQDDSDVSQSQPARRGPGRLKGSKNWKAPPPTPEELAYEAELTSSMQEALDENQDLDPSHTLPTPPATQGVDNASPAGTDAREISDQPSNLPLRINPEDCNPKKDPPGPAVNTSIGNSGTISLDPAISEEEFDSDPEVSTCLLNEAERALKEKIWVTENADWLRQDHAKRIKRELKDRHLREQGIDPDELRKGKKGELRKRKDGARRSGRVGDVGYLKDEFHQKNNQDETSQYANAGADGDTSGRRPSAASLNVQAMLKQRGTYSRRINYPNLMKAYEYPVGSSSPSRSPSVDRESREQSVVSISSTGTAASGTGSIGPIFTATKPSRRRSVRPSTSSATTRSRQGPAQRDRNQGRRSPSAISSIESSATPEPDEDASRRRLGSAASPEPLPGRTSGVINDQEDEDPTTATAAGTKDPPSSSASPLSSTHTPFGVDTPGSSGSGPLDPTTKIDRSMYGDLGRVGVAASGSRPGNDSQEVEEDDDFDNDDDEGDEVEEDDDDDDDDDEENDPDDDIEDAFAGNFREKPVWEGEDEIVEE